MNRNVRGVIVGYGAVQGAIWCDSDKALSPVFLVAAELSPGVPAGSSMASPVVHTLRMDRVAVVAE